MLNKGSTFMCPFTKIHHAVIICCATYIWHCTMEHYYVMAVYAILHGHMYTASLAHQIYSPIDVYVYYILYISCINSL